MKTQRIHHFRVLLIFSFLFFLSGDLPTALAQLRRPGYVKVKKEDRTTSRLAKEDGAIYLEEIMDKEVVVHIKKSVPAYSNLTGKHWLGNVLPNQKAVLLAVSDRAYRVRARAKQGQIAGWISKAVVEGLDPSFEKNLKIFYDRYVIVKKLIDNEQVAIGMTSDEVVASLGPPDLRSSSVEQTGRKDTMEYISYKRVPQTVTSVDPFGFPVLVTQYVEVEAGRVSIELTNNMVSSIRESQGINLARPANGVNVPPPVYLF